MTIEGKPEPTPALNELLGEVLRNGADLVQNEVALLRAELAASVRRVAYAIIMFIGAAAFCVIALGLAVDALIIWLTPVFGSEAIATIVCSVGAALVAVALILIGYSQIRVDSIYPERTTASLRSDVRVLHRRMS